MNQMKSPAASRIKIYGVSVFSDPEAERIRLKDTRLDTLMAAAGFGQFVDNRPLTSEKPKLLYRIGIFSGRRVAAKVASLFPNSRIQEFDHEEDDELLAALERSDGLAVVLASLSEEQLQAITELMALNPKERWFKSL